MLTNEQMENLWWKYRREGIDRNLSLQAFCFFKLRRNLSEVPPVTNTDMPSQEVSIPIAMGKIGEGVTPKESASMGCKNRIMVSIRMTNGIHITKRDMDYQGLRSPVEKLEVLC